MLSIRCQLKRSLLRKFHTTLPAYQGIKTEKLYTPKKVVFVTGNKAKLKEVHQILGDQFPFPLINQDIDLPEYQGEPDQVSTLKCRSAFEIVKAPVLVEDTSLFLNALGGLPGPYIKCFLKKLGAEGIFKILQGFGDYSAVFRSTLAYCDGDVSSIKLFKGMTSGIIVNRKKTNGLSWNVSFQPNGHCQTYTEMSAEEKNRLSHRKKAVEAMKEHFLSLKSS